LSVTKVGCRVRQSGQIAGPGERNGSAAVAGGDGFDAATGSLRGPWPPQGAPEPRAVLGREPRTADQKRSAPAVAITWPGVAW